MNYRNSRSGDKTIFPLAMIVAVTVFLFSCQKDGDSKVHPKNGMNKVAASINGEMFTGAVTSESDNNQFAITYDNRNKVILMGKIPNSDYPDIQDVKSAEMIISK